MHESGAEFDTWKGELVGLCADIRERTRHALLQAQRSGEPQQVTRRAGQGVGDWTFGLDLPSEERIAAWLQEQGARAPISVLTEDTGWSHRAPGSSGPRDLETFGHAGPRIAFDPVDGTRNLMSDLRSAWTVVSFAGPGSDAPRFSDVQAGLVSEIPTTRADRYRIYSAERGGPCVRQVRSLANDDLLEEEILRCDEDDRPDQGYFPFFRYDPVLRPALAQLESAFFERLERFESAELRSVYDDQYISSAGQLMLLSEGTYRMVVDARAWVARRAGRTTVTSKPYDVAGALVVAEAAGAVVTAASGRALDFPIDAETPVDFAGYANRPTQERLQPHWLAVTAS